MTREYHIEILKQYKEKPTLINGVSSVEEAAWLDEALDAAIKALEQEPVLDKIRAEIKEWYWQADKQTLAKDPCVVDAMIDLFIRTIDKYRAESEESDADSN